MAQAPVTTNPATASPATGFPASATPTANPSATPTANPSLSPSTGNEYCNKYVAVTAILLNMATKRNKYGKKYGFNHCNNLVT